MSAEDNYDSLDAIERIKKKIIAAGSETHSDTQQSSEPDETQETEEILVNEAGERVFEIDGEYLTQEEIDDRMEEQASIDAHNKREQRRARLMDESGDADNIQSMQAKRQQKIEEIRYEKEKKKLQIERDFGPLFDQDWGFN